MSQTTLIREALVRGERLTPMDALVHFGCFRLGARIWDLRQAGMQIDCTMITTPNGKRVAEYRLASADE